jgi:hypothetical protein
VGWALLVVGLTGVVVGLVQLASYFRGGLGDRALAASGPAEKLVRAAMFVTGGLFLGFFGIANLVARSLAGP